MHNDDIKMDKTMSAEKLINQIDCTESELVVAWQSGRVSRYHWLWLRDNCPTAFHPITQERVFDLMSVPDDLTASEALLTDEGLKITWLGDAHTSLFDLDWLQANDPAFADIAEVSDKACEIWSSPAQAQAIPDESYDAYVTSDAVLTTWLQALSKNGLAMLRNVPTERESVTQVAERINYMRRTNFGITFDVRSEKKPINQAYTADFLPLHTDLPNHETPPGFQFLHCLENSAEGGMSTFADGFAIANRLRETNSEAFDLLCRYAIPFRFHDEEQDLIVEHPVIRLNERGDIHEVKYSPHLASHFNLPADVMPAYYRAYRAFMTLVQSAEFTKTIKLNAGDLVAFDNRRVMHGRTSFDPSTGNRHLRGCYVDRGEVLSRLRKLS